MYCGFMTESWEQFYCGIFKLTKVLTGVVKIMILLGLLKRHVDWKACRCWYSNGGIILHQRDICLSIQVLKGRFPL